MRRLALVGSTRLNPVIRTNRDVQLFLHIAIEIPKKHTDAAVRILEPTLIGRPSRFDLDSCKGSMGNCPDCPFTGGATHTSHSLRAGSQEAELSPTSAARACENSPFKVS